MRILLKYVKLNIGLKYSFYNPKSKKLGVTYHPLENTVTDHAAQLMLDKLV